MKYDSQHVLSIYDTEPNPSQLLYEWKPGQSRYHIIRFSNLYVVKKIWYESQDGSLRCFVTVTEDSGDRTFPCYIREKDLQILINGTTNQELTARILGMKKDWLHELLLYINRFLRSFA